MSVLGEECPLNDYYSLFLNLHQSLSFFLFLSSCQVSDLPFTHVTVTVYIEQLNKKCLDFEIWQINKIMKNKLKMTTKNFGRALYNYILL